MAQTEIIHLSPNGTYKTSRATQDGEWPNMLFTKVDGQRQAFSLIQNPSFLVDEKPFLMGIKPVRFDSWERFESTDPPRPSLTTNTRLVLAEGNNPYPIACAAPPTFEEKKYIGEALYEEMDQSAQNKASQEELGGGAKRYAFLMMASVAFLLAVVLGFIVAAERFG